ncbi:hypothetical protein E2562_015398 [Oryza meyeriana var. granulata]|uniref:DUF834 domain-containing protein n=1 Tax=Oryza meyeriana var. granulata TaxID=110450 RepID=A0A6G1EJ76_9ORYZ|nr:hypothetical protein E2562_015398 [Oryza meyeriana var. granulata]
MVVELPLGEEGARAAGKRGKRQEKGVCVVEGRSTVGVRACGDDGERRLGGGGEIGRGRSSGGGEIRRGWSSGEIGRGRSSRVGLHKGVVRQRTMLVAVGDEGATESTLSVTLVGAGGERGVEGEKRACRRRPGEGARGGG